jgi:LruC domain-containing protein
MKYKTYLLLGLVLFTIMFGCDKSTPADESFTPFSDLVVSDDFDFNTLRNVDVNLEAYTNNGTPLPGMVFRLFDADPDNGGSLISTGAIDNTGTFTTRVSIPASIKDIYAVGMMQTVKIPVVNNKVEHVFGGLPAAKATGFKPVTNASKDYQYLPWLTYNAAGVPNPMTWEGLSPTYLTHINNTFPERVNQTTLHPQFFAPGINHNIRVNDNCELYITFINDGGAYQSALGFYTYNQGATPGSVTDIEPLTLIFPNASIAGGGGGLNPGDRVYLGSVPAGKMVGFFLVADGYEGGANVGPGLNRYFTDNALNPEVAADKRAHTVLVYDPVYHRLVLGFEDKFREPGGGSDNDFNDVMFSIQVTPELAIDPGDYPVVIPPTDRDGDGIPDDDDDYPDDPTKAWNNYTPSETTWGTLAYEDLWPAYGDYDFNDLVVDYNINQITNAYNRVAYVESRYKVSAIGARHRNGFAVEYPFNAANITNLTCNLPYYTLEAGGPNAVIRLFDNAFQIIPQQVGGAFINTESTQPYIAPVQINLNFRLVTPLAPASFVHQPPYNPFLIANQERGREVHLAGYAPTSLVNTAYFGTGADGSDPVHGRFYYSTTNLPFALNIAQKWNYPLEKNQVTKGYLKFKDWAQSNGALYPDWYDNNPGYLNPAHIYNRP